MMVLLKLAVLGFFVFVGWKYVKPENWHPFAPTAGADPGRRCSGLLAYIGFDAVSTVAEECATRSATSRRIIGSLIRVHGDLIVVAAVFTGIIPYSALVKVLATQQAEPLTLALQYARSKTIRACLSGLSRSGSVVAHTAVLLVFQARTAEDFFSMAKGRPASIRVRKGAPEIPHAACHHDPDGCCGGRCSMFVASTRWSTLTISGRCSHSRWCARNSHSAKARPRAPERLQDTLGSCGSAARNRFHAFT